MVLDPMPQSLPVHFFGSRPQPPTSPRHTVCTQNKRRVYASKRRGKRKTKQLCLLKENLFSSRVFRSLLSKRTSQKENQTSVSSLNETNMFSARVWNIIFTFYYTRVRPQCDCSILGRSQRESLLFQSLSFSSLKENISKRIILTCCT